MICFLLGVLYVVVGLIIIWWLDEWELDYWLDEIVIFFGWVLLWPVLLIVGSTLKLVKLVKDKIATIKANRYLNKLCINCPKRNTCEKSKVREAK